jgi:hypothetical protein
MLPALLTRSLETKSNNGSSSKFKQYPDVGPQDAADHRSCPR